MGVRNSSESSKKRARYLRRSMSAPEHALWQRIRKNALGVAVRTQYPVGDYILDFYVHSARLAIEVDGTGHRPWLDEKRDAELKRRGIETVRVTTYDIGRALDDVVAFLAVEVEQRIETRRQVHSRTDDQG